MMEKLGHLSNKSGQVSKKTGQVMAFFYEYPRKKVTVRELAAKMKVSKSTLHTHLKILREQGLISSNNQWIDNWQNRLKKTFFNVELIVNSGIVDYLESELAARAIILFGSFAKGESERRSDIDIFVESARKADLNLLKYGKSLGYNIQLFTKPKITNLPKHLLNNVVNGVKLRGYFTVK